ncbi:hypothetical protein HBA_0453 [Sodalis endosymbiont of Henestaris halophilus]|nr:hypothetical protein HBA_0453 [Sodalis endosymbiont of Henestaris halophilus]
MRGKSHLIGVGCQAQEHLALSFCVCKWSNNRKIFLHTKGALGRVNNKLSL